MRILVLDPRRGSLNADVLVLGGPDLSIQATLRLGYVPEVIYDAANREIVVVDTDLVQSNGEATRFWLKTFDADTLQPRLKCEIPVRPMYAGFPGRSHRVATDASGRFIYALESAILRSAVGFRITTNRY